MEMMKLKKITKMKSRRVVKLGMQHDDDEVRDIFKIVEKQAEIIRNQLVQILRIEKEIDILEEIVYVRRCQVCASYSFDLPEY